ncbi:MAG: phosphoserine phosphatase SerB [Sphingomonadales bacterium]|nr:phosphoserine phosphatase SerB [Sphingomonadales bacterium]
MNNVATLIVKPETGLFSANTLKTVEECLLSAKIEVGNAIWLSTSEALDISFNGDMDAAKGALEALFKDQPVDIAVQPIEGRKKAMLIADMDSTMIEVECIDEIAAELGIKEKVAPITEAAMRGELDFNAALKERVALLKGLDVAKLQHVYDTRITFTAGAKELIATMNASGAHTVLISGGFTYFTDRVSAYLGFKESHANHLSIEGGKLSGHVKEPILNAASKFNTLVHIRDERGLSHASVLAVGDGANDIPMIEEAGLGIAYHAKEKARNAADVAVNHNDLRALLFVQGYRASDIITA